MGDACVAAVLALLRFNKDVSVGSVVMGPAIGAMVASVSSSGSGSPVASLRVLNGLVDAMQRTRTSST